MEGLGACRQRLAAAGGQEASILAALIDAYNDSAARCAAQPSSPDLAAALQVALGKAVLACWVVLIAIQKGGRGIVVGTALPASRYLSRLSAAAAAATRPTAAPG